MSQALVYAPKAYKLPCATFKTFITPYISVSPDATKNNQAAYTKLSRIIKGNELIITNSVKYNELF